MLIDFVDADSKSTKILILDLSYPWKDENNNSKVGYCTKIEEILNNALVVHEIRVLKCCL
jgi:hypothetical protein